MSSNEAVCVWCERNSRNGVRPEACGHRQAMTAAQRVEEWLRREASDVDAILAVVLGDELAEVLS